MSEKTKDIISWIICIVIAVALAIIIRYFVGTQTIVKQQSMWPTLQPNERLILNRWFRTTNQMPERGDIITFQAPSRINVTKEDANLLNPVARYDNDPTGTFSKFAFYVLEIGKDSFIKRVIGLPGDHIQILEGRVYVNNALLKESYLKPDVKTEGDYPFMELDVPEGTVFVMGDNRPSSTDSRAFGCIPIEKIEGKVIFRIWPFSAWGKIEK